MNTRLLPQLRPGLAFVLLFAAIALLAFSATRIFAQDPGPQKILKNRMLFQHGKVLVSLPKRDDGSMMLRAFTTEDYDIHYGDGHRPEYAFIDDSSDSRFSVSVTPTKLELDGLETYKEKMEKSLNKAVKDIIWHKREILDIGEIKWIHLEMQNRATDSSMVMSDFYVTAMGGHPLMFTLQTTSKQWYEMRKVMQHMMLSVQIAEQRKPVAGATDAKPAKK